jgi:hypothetical protein
MSEHNNGLAKIIQNMKSSGGIVGSGESVGSVLVRDARHGSHEDHWCSLGIIEGKSK